MKCNLDLTEMQCDERKPTCGTCARLGKTCEAYRPEFKFRTVTTPPSGERLTASELPNQQIVRVTERELGGNQSPFDALSVGSIDLIKSLQHSERDIFYSTIWEDYCLPAMHPMFTLLSGCCGRDQMLRDATLALSSCTFSRLHPEKKSSTASHMGSFSPDLVHQTRSQLYYSSAIQQFTLLSEDDCRKNLPGVLTVLTIFAYIESSMGNFHGFYCHDQGMLTLLLQLHTNSEDSTLQALIAAWMQVRFVVWWARAHFCSMEVLRRLPSVLSPMILTSGLSSIQERRAMVLSIMCESHRLNFRTLMAHWDVGDPEHLVNQEMLSEDEDHETAYFLLNDQAQALDRWTEQLPSSDLPIQSHDTSEENDETDSGDSPLRFQSHEAAMNFAYYVIARIMQCTGLLRVLQTRESSYIKYEFHEEEAWTRLLLRIARGTNMQTSLRMNNYTIGFSGLLLTALLRCQSQSLGAEVQSWLQSLADLKPTEEGAFPLYQTLGIVKSINQQKVIRRDVLGLTQPVDDSGGMPKFSAYNSQPISTLLFHGIDQLSGDLFTECVSIDL